MNKTYKVAGHCFRVSGERICQAVSLIDGFLPFECEEGKPLFEFVEAMEQCMVNDVVGKVTGICRPSGKIVSV